MEIRMNEHAKNVMDALSIGGVLATLAGWLPSIAAVLSIIWTLIRILETETFRKFSGWASLILRGLYDSIRKLLRNH